MLNPFSAAVPVLRVLQFGQTLPNQPYPGHKVRIWKQDPSVAAIGIRTQFIHTPIQPGPKDDAIVIKGMPSVVKPDKNGDYLYDPIKSPKEFDSVHTFAVVRQVLTMAQRAMNRTGINNNFTWQWGGAAPVAVYPNAGDTPNAYYSRGQKAMKFFYFTPEGKSDASRVFTNRSFDIVSHETGHAVLDGLKPGFLSSYNPQTGGLHESFGDLQAIFTMLAQLDQCEAIIAESKANLHDKSFFNSMAEEFGTALGRDFGLRNANNTLKMSDVTTEVHDISQVFTGAVYNILADMFDDAKNLTKEDPAHTLLKVGDHLYTILIGALKNSSDKNATYKQVAENMIALETNPKWKAIINARFVEREIPVGGTELAFVPKPLNWKNTCGTMQRAEHKNLFATAIKEAQFTLKTTGKLP